MNVVETIHNFFLEIPGKYEHIIRFYVFDFVGMIHWNKCTGKKLSLTERIAINCKIQEVGTNAAIIQQRISLTRCSITNDSLSFMLGSNQKLKNFPFCFLRLLLKGAIVIQCANTGIPFLLQ